MSGRTDIRDTVSKRINLAMLAIKREDFLPAAETKHAKEDRPLPIGYGQTNSQPSTVIFMLELLHPLPGHKVLDIGSGSGWTTALLAHCIGSSGSVLGLEVISELVKMGQTNLARYPLPWASIRAAGTIIGAPQHAPFDRILVSASAHELPHSLLDQLNDPGVLVAPVGHAVHQIIKRDGQTNTTIYPGFAFVPLIA